MIALALLVCVMLAALALSSFCSGTETGLSSVSGRAFGVPYTVADEEKMMRRQPASSMH